MLLSLNDESLEYDVYSLVKAFFPEKDLRFDKKENDVKSVNYDKEGVSKSDITGDKVERIIVQADKEGAAFKYTNEGTKQSVERDWCFDETKDKYKDEFKKAFYTFLSDITGKTLPWGNLIGIRPTKIAYGLLEEGKSEAEIFKLYREKHFTSEEKSLLAIDIAKREKELLTSNLYKDGYSLYVGIPFCPSTCLYCSFTSYPIFSYRKRVEEYIDCVIKEIDYVAENFKGQRLNTVYMGGGTPTTLSAEQLDRLLGALKEKLDFSTVLEFTVEAGRADSITKEKLEVLKKHGVQRISVNPQTMKQETLDIIGRKASVEQVREAYKMAREVGFDNINMDLILGLPGELACDVQNTIDEVVQMNPDSLTVHSLAIKRASKLNQWIKKNGITALNNTEETMRIAIEGSKRLGMHPYYLYQQKNMSGNFENVGYAKEGKYGLYNILIMEEVQNIVACGAGTVTKRVYPDGRIERCDTVKDVNLYISQIDEMIERKRHLFVD